MLSPVLVILAVISVALSFVMLFAKNAVTAALSLLGILIMSAAIYGLIGEHLVATIQLVVYAGAIMVLFVFSIMLLNLNKSESDFARKPMMYVGVMGLGFLVVGVLVNALHSHFTHQFPNRIMGPFSHEYIKQLGGNSKVLSFALFSQYFISFEVISLALLTAVVGAVVLAKRHVD